MLVGPAAADEQCSRATTGEGLGSLSEAPDLQLSVIVPAYNEQQRLPETLARIEKYLGETFDSAEIIVANDGSTDKTSEIASNFTSESVAIRVLNLPHRGKAAAVRAGILAARGRYHLFTDADLSTPIEYATDVIEALERGADVAIGTREGLTSHRVGEPAYRHMMGRAFNFLVQLIAIRGINDSQCGFKGFRKDVAIDLFSQALLYNTEKEVSGPRVTAFDVEILFLARSRGYSIVEIPVSWTHVSGSKVNPALDSIRMLGDVLQVRLNALLGRYNRDDRG